MFAENVFQDEAPSRRRSAGCSGCRRAKKGCDMQSPVCGRCLRLSQTCYRGGFGNNIGEGVAYGSLGDASMEYAQGIVDQHPIQSGIRKADKKGNESPRSLGDWSDILRHFADHGLIRGLIAACKLHDAIPQLNSKQVANIYGAAISSIREAIQKGWHVADDTVLVVTLLLYIYERFYWPEERSSHCWMIHIQGAISLVQARGFKQIQTKVGRVIFRKARDIILDVTFCNSVVPPYFLILGSQAMGRDVLYHDHDQLAILETRTIVLYWQYRRGDIDQALIQTAHALQQELTYRQKTTVHLPCNSLGHRQDSVAIDSDEQEKQDEYLSAEQGRWSGAKLHIFRLVVCRVQSAVFRKLWNTSAIGIKELVPCCQNCPTHTSEIMCNSAADIMNGFESICLSMLSPSATLGMHGAIFTASSCLKSELEELTSCGVHSDAIVTPTQLISMKRSSQWLTEWSKMLVA